MESSVEDDKRSKETLGDLTGIKKHFSRKHGEKNWKCMRQVFQKVRLPVRLEGALYKTCGTREYRRNSFITHRAFCDALAEESTKDVVQTNAVETNYGTSDEYPTVFMPSPSPSQQKKLLPAATSPHAPLSTTTFTDLIAAVSSPDRRGFKPSSSLEATSLVLSATRSINLFSGGGS